MKCLAVVVAVGAVACGYDGPPRPPCDTLIGQACVSYSRTGRVYDGAAMSRMIDAALLYWRAPPNTLDGWAISFENDAPECGGGAASGCTWWDSRIILLQALDPDCPETSQLVHEIGHVLHHDPDHRGPWWNRTGEQDATYDAVRSPDAMPECAQSRYYTVRP